MVDIVHEKFRDITNVTVKVTIPITVWEKWNLDCIENFNNVRWLKMKYDHDFREQFKPIANHVIKDLTELEETYLDLKARVHEIEKVFQNPAYGAEISKPAVGMTGEKFKNE